MHSAAEKKFQSLTIQTENIFQSVAKRPQQKAQANITWKWPSKRLVENERVWPASHDDSWPTSKSRVATAGRVGHRRS